MHSSKSNAIQQFIINTAAAPNGGAPIFKRVFFFKIRKTWLLTFFYKWYDYQSLKNKNTTSARHQPKLQDNGHGASVSHGVPVYLPALRRYKKIIIIFLGVRGTYVWMAAWFAVKLEVAGNWTSDLQSQVATGPHSMQWFKSWHSKEC